MGGEEGSEYSRPVMGGEMLGDPDEGSDSDVEYIIVSLSLLFLPFSPLTLPPSIYCFSLNLLLVIDFLGSSQDTTI